MDRPTNVRPVLGSSASGSADRATTSVPPALGTPDAGADDGCGEEPIELQPVTVRVRAARAATIHRVGLNMFRIRALPAWLENVIMSGQGPEGSTRVRGREETLR